MKALLFISILFFAINLSAQTSSSSSSVSKTVTSNSSGDKSTCSYNYQQNVSLKSGKVDEVRQVIVDAFGGSDKKNHWSSKTNRKGYEIILTKNRLTVNAWSQGCGEDLETKIQELSDKINSITSHSHK